MTGDDVIGPPSRHHDVIKQNRIPVQKPHDAKGARFLKCVPQRRARGWYGKSECQNGIFEAILDKVIFKAFLKTSAFLVVV